MKNNRITLGQFWFSMMLSCLISILFIDEKGTVLFILECAAALAINLFVINLCGSKADFFVKAVACIYFTLFSVISALKFLDYLCSVLDYSPPWFIALVLFGFAYFCMLKGVEAISRAAAVIGIFTLFALLYILICSASKINFGLSFDTDNNLLPSLTLLFPSAAYAVLGESVVEKKRYISVIFSSVILVLMICFSLLAFKAGGKYPVHTIPAAAHIGVFRGADFLLLAFLSVSSLYIISISGVSLFSSFRNKYTSAALYITVLLGLTILALYSEQIRDFLLLQPFILVLSTATVSLIILYSLIKKIKVKVSMR